MNETNETSIIIETMLRVMRRQERRIASLQDHECIPEGAAVAIERAEIERLTAERAEARALVGASTARMEALVLQVAELKAALDSASKRAAEATKALEETTNRLAVARAAGEANGRILDQERATSRERIKALEAEIVALLARDPTKMCQCGHSEAAHASCYGNVTDRDGCACVAFRAASP